MSARGLGFPFCRETIYVRMTWLALLAVVCSAPAVADFVSGQHKMIRGDDVAFVWGEWTNSRGDMSEVASCVSDNPAGCSMFVNLDPFAPLDRIFDVVFRGRIVDGVVTLSDAGGTFKINIDDIGVHNDDEHGIAAMVRDTETRQVSISIMAKEIEFVHMWLNTREFSQEECYDTSTVNSRLGPRSPGPTHIPADTKEFIANGGHFGHVTVAGELWVVTQARPIAITLSSLKVEPGGTVNVVACGGIGSIIIRIDAPDLDSNNPKTGGIVVSDNAAIYFRVAGKAALQSNKVKHVDQPSGSFGTSNAALVPSNVDIATGERLIFASTGGPALLHAQTRFVLDRQRASDSPGHQRLKLSDGRPIKPARSCGFNQECSFVVRASGSIVLVSNSDVPVLVLSALGKLHMEGTEVHSHSKRAPAFCRLNTPLLGGRGQSTLQRVESSIIFSRSDIVVRDVGSNPAPMSLSSVTVLAPCSRAGCLSTSNLEIQGLDLIETIAESMFVPVWQDANLVQDPDPASLRVGLVIAPQDPRAARPGGIRTFGFDIGVALTSEAPRGLERVSRASLFNSTVIGARVAGVLGTVPMHGNAASAVPVDVSQLVVLDTPLGAVAETHAFSIEDLTCVGCIVSFTAMPHHDRVLDLVKQPSSANIAAVKVAVMDTTCRSDTGGGIPPHLPWLAEAIPRPLAIAATNILAVTINDLEIKTSTACSSSALAGFGQLPFIKPLGYVARMAVPRLEVSQAVLPPQLSEAVCWQPIEVSEDLPLNPSVAQDFRVHDRDGGIGGQPNTILVRDDAFALPEGFRLKCRRGSVSVSMSPFWVCPSAALASSHVWAMDIESLLVPGPFAVAVVQRGAQSLLGPTRPILLPWAFVILPDHSTYSVKVIGRDAQSVRPRRRVLWTFAPVGDAEHRLDLTSAGSIKIEFQLDVVGETATFAFEDGSLLDVISPRHEDAPSLQQSSATVKFDVASQQITLNVKPGSDERVSLAIEALSRSAACGDSLCSPGEYTATYLCREDCGSNLTTFQVSRDVLGDPAGLIKRGQLSSDEQRLHAARVLGIPDGVFYSLSYFEDATRVLVDVFLPPNSDGLWTNPPMTSAVDRSSLPKNPNPGQHKPTPPPSPPPSPTKRPDGRKTDSPPAGNDGSNGNNDLALQNGLIATVVGAAVVIVLVVLGMTRRRSHGQANVAAVYHAGDANEPDNIGDSILAMSGASKLGQGSIIALAPLVSGDGQAFCRTLESLTAQDLNTAPDSDKNTLLHWAVRLHDTAAVQALVSMEVDVDAINLEGRTPLHYACMNGDSAELALLLLNAGANPSIEDDEGMTALHLAACEGGGRMVELLLSRGASLKARDEKGMTALMHAIVLDQRETIDALLGFVQCGNADISDLIVQDERGWTALHWAASIDDARTVNALLEIRRLDLSIRDEQARNVLHVACREGSFQAINALLARKPNVVPSQQLTLLLDTDLSCNTPSDIARDQGFDDVVSLLEECQQTLNAAWKPRTHSGRSEQDIEENPIILLERLLDDRPSSSGKRRISHDHKPVVRVKTEKRQAVNGRQEARKARRREAWHRKQQQEKERVDRLKEQAGKLAVSNASLQRLIDELERQRRVLLGVLDDVSMSSGSHGEDDASSTYDSSHTSVRTPDMVASASEREATPSHASPAAHGDLNYGYEKNIKVVVASPLPLAGETSL